VLLSNPYGATGFNIQRVTLYGMVRGWLEREGDFPWRVLQLVEKRAAAEESSAEYAWQPVTETRQVTVARVLVVHPALAGYLPDEGFIADRAAGSFRSTLSPSAAEGTWERTHYRLESYAEHIRQVLGAFADLALPELGYVAPALECAAGWLPGSVTQAAWLVCFFHDVGKLSVGWQAWARAYQKQIGAPVAANFAAAHTDSEPGNARHQAVGRALQGRRPNHAAESALAVGPALVEALGYNEPLVRAALTAIARHHTPQVDESQKYTLETQAGRHLTAALQHLPQAQRQGLNLAQIKGKGPGGAVATVRPDDLWGWLAYLLLARALRRADQEGTARGARGA